MLLNTRMGTLPNAASTIGNLPNTNNAQSQGPIGPIVQDRDMTEASRTRVTSDQRSSVYIGQVHKYTYIYIYIRICNKETKILYNYIIIKHDRKNILK